MPDWEAFGGYFVSKKESGFQHFVGITYSATF